MTVLNGCFKWYKLLITYIAISTCIYMYKSKNVCGALLKTEANSAAFGSATFTPTRRLILNLLVTL